MSHANISTFDFLPTLLLLSYYSLQEGFHYCQLIVIKLMWTTTLAGLFNIVLCSLRRLDYLFTEEKIQINSFKMVAIFIAADGRRQLD